MTHSRPRHRAVLTLLLTATLGTAPQASALDTSILNNLGSLGSLFQQWQDKIQTFMNLKDQLFGQVNFEDLSNSLMSRLQDVGLSKLSQSLGLDLPKLIGDAKNWQSKIDEIKQGIMKSFADRFQALLNPNTFDRKNKLWEAGMLNPDTFAMKFDGLIKQQQEAINKSRNVQDMADSVRALDDTKKTVEETAKNSAATTQKAGEFANKVQQIQSTREGVMMLVQAQAAMMANQAYNANALTAAVSQQARQQQVTNNQLADLVNDRIEERTGEVLGAMHAMRLEEARAVALGKQTRESIEWAANGFSAAFGEINSAKSDSMFQ